jgi:hypothetical protein
VSFTEEAASPAYQRWAEKESKAYIGFFLLTCIAFAIFSHQHIGWLWLVVVPIGMITASIVGGAFSISSKYLEHRRVLVLPHLLSFAGMGAVIALSWWSLSNVGH